MVTAIVQAIIKSNKGAYNLMKWINMFITLVIFSVYSIFTNAATTNLNNYNGGEELLDSISFSQVSNSANSDVTATIEGYLGFPTYIVSPETEVTVFAGQNSIFIKLFVVASSTDENQSMAKPFEIMTDIALFTTGIYDVRVDLFFGDKSIESISTQLEVSAVPLPPAVWLLLSGLVSLFAFGKKGRAILNPAH